MARQGCRQRCSLWKQVTCFAILLATQAWWAHPSFAQATTSPQAQPAAHTAADVSLASAQLELIWTSPAPAYWTGQVAIEPPTLDSALNSDSVSTARLSKVINRTPGLALVGGIFLDAGGRVLTFSPASGLAHFRDRSGRFVSPRTNQGKLGFQFDGPRQQTLFVNLTHDGIEEPQKTIEVPLATVLAGTPYVHDAGDGHTWTLQRRPNDRLRVSLSVANDQGAAPSHDAALKATSVFWDNQLANIQVVTDIEDVTAELVCDTFADGVQMIATQSWPITIESGRAVLENAQWQPPLGDGSYQLRWRIQSRSANKTWIGGPFASTIAESITNPRVLLGNVSDQGTLAESYQTVYVLQNKQTIAPEPSGEMSSTVVGRLEPFGRSWSISRLNPIRQASDLISTGATELRRVVVNGKSLGELHINESWQQALPVHKAGRRHQLVLSLPLNQSAKVQIQIVERTAEGETRVLRDVTSIREPSTSAERFNGTKVEVDFYPLTTNAQLRLINRHSSEKLVFDAIEVQTLDSPQADAAVAVTSAGPDLPRQREALLYIELTQWLQQFASSEDTENASGDHQHGQLRAAMHLAAHVRREGFSGVMMPVVCDGVSLVPVENDSLHDLDRRSESSPAIPGTTLELLLRVFDREQLTFVPCLRPNFPIASLEQRFKTDANAAIGISVGNPWTAQSVELPLGQAEDYPGTLYNPLDQRVQEVILELVEQLATRCDGHRSVATVCMLADEGSLLQLPPPRATSDAATLGRFYASLSQPRIARAQLTGWMEGAEGSKAFGDWRDQQMTSLYQRLLSVAERNSQQLLVATTRHQFETAQRLETKSAALLTTRLYRRSPLGSLAAQSHDEWETGHGAATEPTDLTRLAGAALCLIPLGVSDLATQDLSSAESQVDLDETSIALLFTRPLSRGDRRLIAMSDDPSAMNETVHRISRRRFCRLPDQILTDVAPADEAMKMVKLRQGASGEQSFLYVTNHSPWPVQVHVSLDRKAAVKALLPSDTAPRLEADGTWRVWLMPGELNGLCASGSVHVRSWSAQLDPTNLSISSIGKQVRELADSLALITEPKAVDWIENPSFESMRAQALPAAGESAAQQVAIAPSSIQVPGWLMAQHPEGCAACDDQVAKDGRYSIRLRNLDGRPGGTWIVSRPLNVPATGRLAISIMIRGEPTENPAQSPPIVVRLAIEGSVGGNSMRESRLIEVPRNGQWSANPYRIAVDSLPRCGVDSLRLAVDLMSEGTVWIDQIQAYDVYMNDMEKSQLQSQMFLALSGLSKGELSHTAKLLDLPWVQHPFATARPVSGGSPMVPTAQTAVPALDRQPVGSDKRGTNSPRPGMAERLKGWLPRPLRF